MYSGKGVGESSPSLSNVTDLIRMKEKELHHFHNLRTNQLESIIDEQQKMINEANKRFNLLKEDFQYNLTLIEARDAEIVRLEKELKARKAEEDEYERKIRTLNNKIETMQQKEREKQEKNEQEKQAGKRLLEELRATIETTRWTANEEIRNKSALVEKLRQDIQDLHRHKEEALEIQRRDLTQTFEQIIERRDQMWKAKEVEISKQIQVLEEKFDKLQTENTRLKNKNRELTLQVEELQNDLQHKEESLRQLNYKLEDTTLSKQSVEDSYQRQLNALSSELKSIMDSKGLENKDYQLQIEKLKQDLNREREQRQLIAHKHDEQQQLNGEQLARLHEDLRETQHRLSSSLQENDFIKSERDHLLHSLASKRMEHESLLSKMDVMTNEQMKMSKKQEELLLNISSLETQLLTKQQEIKDLRNSMNSQEKQHFQMIEQRLEEEKQKCEYQLLQASTAHREEVQALKDKHAFELREYQKQLNNLQNLNSNQHSQEIDSLRSQLAHSNSLLSNEKMENEAMKLRLKVQEQQLLAAQQELKTIYANNGNKRNTNTIPSTRNNNNNGPLSLGDISITDLPPLPSPLTSLQDHQYFGSNINSKQNPADNLHISLPTSPVPFSSSYIGRSAGSNTNDTDHEQVRTLQDENEKLKNIVKEMRREIEQVQADLHRSQNSNQSMQRSPSRAFNNTSHNTPNRLISGQTSPSRTSPRLFNSDNALTSIEQRLQQSNEEIIRLRSERKKLMDTGNELRSALMKVQRQQGLLTHQQMEEMRRENVETVYEWIRSTVRDGKDENETSSSSHRREKRSKSVEKNRKHLKQSHKIEEDDDEHSDEREKLIEMNDLDCEQILSDSYKLLYSDEEPFAVNKISTNAQKKSKNVWDDGYILPRNIKTAEHRQTTDKQSRSKSRSTSREKKHLERINNISEENDEDESQSVSDQDSLSAEQGKKELSTSEIPTEPIKMQSKLEVVGVNPSAPKESKIITDQTSFVGTTTMKTSGIALGNTQKTTKSQQQALERIKRKQLQKLQQAKESEFQENYQPRKVINYAKAFAEERKVQEEANEIESI